MAILAQPIIAAPTFADTTENRLHLIAVAELAISTQPTRSDFFSQVHSKTGADWLVIRNIIKGLPLQTVEKSNQRLATANCRKKQVSQTFARFVMV